MVHGSLFMLHVKRDARFCNNMATAITSAALGGICARPLRVEADVSSGLPCFNVVGLPDAAVSESRDRVRAAIKNSGFSFPGGRVTVNLAPADSKKAGSSYDLPIAAAILAECGFLRKLPEGALYVGELSLDGAVRPVPGVLAIAANSGHALALKTNGSVVAWGSNTDGESTVPASALSGVIAIAAGGGHSLAVKTNGSIIPWGRNVEGQTTVPAEAMSGVIAVEGGIINSLALKNDGTVLACDQEFSTVAVHYRRLQNPPDPKWLKTTARARLDQEHLPQPLY